MHSYMTALRLTPLHLTLYRTPSDSHNIALCYAESKGMAPMNSVVQALFALQHAGLEGRMRITFEFFDSRRSGRID